MPPENHIDPWSGCNRSTHWDDRLIRGAPSSLFGPVAFQFVQTETVPPVYPLSLLFLAAFVVLGDRRMTTSGSCTLQDRRMTSLAVSFTAATAEMHLRHGK
jgi:hypothetical protein